VRCNTGGATAVYDMPIGHHAASAESVTLDDVFARTLAEGQRCRLLKVDCEGAEYEILPSALLERVDFLSAEFHEDLFDPSSAARAQVLRDRCAHYIAPDRLRITFCPKQD
jgi:hypothetical protein